MWVADTGSSRLQVFDRLTGAHLETVGGGETGLFLSPVHLAFAADGTLYVSEAATMEILALSPPTYQTVVRRYAGADPNPFQGIGGLAVDSVGGLWVSDPVSHVVRKLDVATGALIATIGGQGTGNGEFYEPNGVAVDLQGNLYVADTGNARVQRFAPSGTFLGSWGSSGSEPNQFNRPLGVAVDDGGFVVVTDQYYGRFQKFTTDGRAIAWWNVDYPCSSGSAVAQWVAVDAQRNVYLTVPSQYLIQRFRTADSDPIATPFANTLTTHSLLSVNGEGSSTTFTYPLDVDVSTDGLVVMSDYYHHRVVLYSESGEFLREFGEFGSEPGNLYLPRGVLVRDGGEIVVADSSNLRLNRYLIDGTFLSDVPMPNSTSPWGLAQDDLGNIYVTTGSGVIQVFDDGFNPLYSFAEAGCGPGQLSNPGSLAVSPNGILYVADSSNHRIQKYSLEGEPLGFLGRLGSAPGQFSAPTDIAFDSLGRMYVSDYGNNRVAVFDAYDTLIGQLGTEETCDVYNIHGIAVGTDGALWVTEHTSHRMTKLVKPRQRLPYLNLPEERLFFSGYIGSFGVGGAFLANPAGLDIAPGGEIIASEIYSHEISVMDRSGMLLRTIGTAGSGLGQLYSPYGVTVLDDTLIAVAEYSNNRVQIMNWQTGEGLMTFGEGVLTYPVDVRRSPDGRFFVTSQGTNRVEVFAADGTHLSSIGTSVRSCQAGELSAPQSIAFAPDGTFFVTEATNHRVQRLTDTGKAVRIWGSYGNQPGQFSTPTGIWVDGPRVLVSDYGNHRIQIFDFNGNVLAVQSESSCVGQLSSPYNLAVGADGTIYVAEFGASRVTKLNRQASQVLPDRDAPLPLAVNGPLPAGEGRLNQPYSVAALPSTGEVFVVEYGRHRVSVFDTNGTYLRSFGSQGSGNGQFLNPRGCTVGPDGMVYVVDSGNARIQKFTSQGNYVSHFGVRGYDAGKLNLPTDVLVLVDGTVVVCDHSNGRVDRFSSQGVYQGTIASALYYPMGMALDGDGQLHVTIQGNHDIHVYALDGTLVEVYGGNGSGYDQFYGLHYLSRGPNNEMWIPDFNQGRIHVRTSAGVHRLVFGSPRGDDSSSCPIGFNGPIDWEWIRPDRAVAVDYYNNRIVYYSYE